MPQGWFAAELRRFKLSTRYELVDDAGVTVVRATAERSSSGLAHNVNLDPREFPILRWRWKVPRPIPGADNTRRDADDSAARVELAFAGPKDRLPLGERAFMAQVKAISGFDMPYATLDYSWGSGAPAGSVVINTWTTRIRSILVRSGPDGMGEWLSEERNVYEDYKAVFGEEPSRVTHVVIYTDADGTRSSAEAFYGDISFARAPQP